MGANKRDGTNGLGADHAMSYFTDLASTLARLDAAPLLPFVRECQGTLWIAGNGGSAAIAQHWACDLSKTAGRRVQALGCNSAILTAWANDDSYAYALTGELDSSARAGDRLICLSCSGRSPNILQLLGYAKQERITRYLITGADAPTQQDSATIMIPHTDYGIIEDCFSAIGHWLTKELS